MTELNNLLSSESLDKHSSQFLSFTLGNEEYGVDILRVQEIRSWEPVSRIPNVPSYEKGVVNL
jgi:purine-binding chemotaxis protein CheW